MKILITGANGYIGMRLLPFLLDKGHQIVCAVRSKNRFAVDKEIVDQIEIVEIDFLEEPKENVLPRDIDAAYYLIHSMSSSTSGFAEKEERSALHFNTYIAQTQCKQIIYLSGIINEEKLSKHLNSRKKV